MANSPLIPNFDADAVRAGLRLAMQVGLQAEEGEQPTFFMPTTVSGDGGHALDAQGTPYVPGYRPARTPRVSRRVPCAIEYHDGAGKIENFGLVSPSRVLLTLLDQDYEQVKGFEYVVIAGGKYWYSKTQPPLGMVDVGVYQVWVNSDDEG